MRCESKHGDYIGFTQRADAMDLLSSHYEVG